MNVWAERIDAGITPALLDAMPGLADRRAVVVHDLDLLECRFAELVATMPANALHAVAIKANPMIEVLRVLVDAGAGLEAASIEEVHVALATGCRPDRIVFDSPAKTVDELAETMRLGLTINVDNVDELRRALQLPRHPDTRLGVRIIPDVGAGAIDATSVGGRASRFGVPVSTLFDEIVPMLAPGAGIDGVHVHAGSQGQSLDQLVSAASTAHEVARRLRAETGTETPLFVDIGGGLPTTYERHDPAPTVADYAERLRRECPPLFDDDVRVITEFGRAVLAPTAMALSRVEYVKHLAGPDGPVRMLVGHLGADFILRAAYAPAQWRHEFSVLRPTGEHATGPHSPAIVAGPLCFAGDVIGRDVPLPVAEPGDWVVIHDVGAYTMAMWSRHCSRGMPLVLGARDGGRTVSVVRRQEEPSDVARFWTASGWASEPSG